MESRYWNRQKRKRRQERVRLHFRNEATHAVDGPSTPGRGNRSQSAARHGGQVRRSPSLSSHQIPANSSDDFLADSGPSESDANVGFVSPGSKRSGREAGLDDGSDIRSSKLE